MNEYIQALKNTFEEYGNPEIAPQMERYMRHKFEFYGLKKPERLAAGKIFIKEFGIPNMDNIPNLLHELWQEPYRELHYFGLDILQKLGKQLPETTIELIEYLIVNQSWWDTVDWLSIRFLGLHMKQFPDTQMAINERFVTSDNFWLNRASILFQLKYKQATDTTLLSSNILKHAHQNEFFIQKAIGWALREYSKTDRNFVIEFVANHQLSTLSKREALKHIQKLQKQSSNRE